MTSQTILILEDDLGRTEAMSVLLKQGFPDIALHIRDSAAAMNAILDQYLDSAIAIALDHDLPITRDEDGVVHDHGNGVEVVAHLIRSVPRCPVLVHSTNTAAADEMESLLTNAGWSTFRVIPYGDLEWINELWYPLMKKSITAHQRGITYPN